MNACIVSLQIGVISIYFIFVCDHAKEVGGIIVFGGGGRFQSSLVSTPGYQYWLVGSLCFPFNSKTFKGKLEGFGEFWRHF